jgi:hypothetical protein
LGRRRWAAWLLVAAFPGAAAAQKSTQPKYRQMASLVFAWDGHPGVQLAFDKDMRRDGPGDFERIRIHVPGRPGAQFVSSDAWVSITSEGAAVEKGALGHNRLSSNYAFGIQRGHGQLSVLLFLTSYGCCVGGIDLIELDRAGKPRLVLHRPHFDLMAIQDLDHDGLPELVGISDFAEIFGGNHGGCFESYDPRLVLHLGARSGEPGYLSLPLSERYNLAHYYGWAGPNYSDTTHVIVLHPKGGGKPFIASEAAAETLVDPAAKCPN